MEQLTVWQTRLDRALEVPLRVTAVRQLRDVAESCLLQVVGRTADGTRTYFAKQILPGQVRESLIYQFAATRPDFPAPPVHFVEEGEERWLLLEPASGQSLAELEDRESCIRAVQGLAAFHQRGLEEGWAGQLQGLGALKDQLEDLPVSALRPTWRGVMEGFYTSVNMILFHRVEERLLRAWPDLMADFKRYPATLIHGDCHAGNLSLTRGGGITLIDWESAATGPGLLDLAGFVDVALRTGIPGCPPEVLKSAYFAELPDRVWSAYGSPDRAWANMRVVRALLELRWFAGTGEDYGHRAVRELNVMERYLER